MKTQFGHPSEMGGVVSLKPEKAEILGVRFDNVTRAEAVERALDLLSSPGKGGYVVTPNAEIVSLCRKDPGLTEVLNGAALVLPDGVGVIYAARILKRPLKGKVAGIDFASALMEELSRREEGLFLLGAKPGVAETAARRLMERYPGLKILGTHDGYFKEEGPVLDAVGRSGASVLFVCLGAPRQEYWMREHPSMPGIRLMVGLGGALDVFAGQVKRAPDLWVKLGLEWLYRLIREPRRIGRMGSRLPAFLFSAVGARLRGAGPADGRG